jgi:hypothetical protein
MKNPILKLASYKQDLNKIETDAKVDQFRMFVEFYKANDLFIDSKKYDDRVFSVNSNIEVFDVKSLGIDLYIISSERIDRALKYNNNPNVEKILGRALKEIIDGKHEKKLSKLRDYRDKIYGQNLRERMK